MINSVAGSFVAFLRLTHMTVGVSKRRFTAAFLRLHLTNSTGEEWGLDFEDMIWGSGEASLCGGGYGTMTACELRREGE